MPEKIKIMHIIPSLRGGGAERVCFDLLMNLDSNKFASTLLLFKDNREGEVWRTQLEAKGIKIISLKKRRLIDLKNFNKVFLTVKKIKPDILHTHLGGDIYGRLTGFMSKVPVIVSTEHNLNQQERKSATYLKALTSAWADMIFPVSEAVKNDALKRYHLTSHKLEVIYNGIDLNVFKPNSQTRRAKDWNEKIIIGGLGRLTEQKGFKVLIDAVLKSKHKDYLVKIGGEGELKNNLQKQIDNLGLTEHVFLVGQVEPVSFLNEIDIFVLPSLWEGLGLVALEAAALNKPIIASEVDGIKEIINQDNGWLFSTGNSSQLANQIDELIENLNSQEVEKKLDLARKTVAEKFSLEKMVSSYSAWYEKLYVRKIKSV